MLPFLADAVRTAVEGPARVIGPASMSLSERTKGFWLRATGEPELVRLDLFGDGLPPATLTLRAQ